MRLFDFFFTSLRLIPPRCTCSLLTTPPAETDPTSLNLIQVRCTCSHLAAPAPTTAAQKKQRNHKDALSPRFGIISCYEPQNKKIGDQRLLTAINRQRQASSVKCHEQCVVSKDQQGARNQQRPARKARSIELRLAGSEQRKTANDQRALNSEK